MYSSHLPVLQSVCEVLLPEGILELGCGLNSTGLFYDYKGDVVTVETDRQWYDKMKETCPDKEGFKFIHHDLGDTGRETSCEDMSEIDFSKTINFYNNATAGKDINLLFIDHIKCLRVNTLQNMYNKFDIILYHDAEDKMGQYGYKNFILDDRDFYHWIYKSFAANTGIIIRKKYKDSLQRFEEVLMDREKEFCKKNGISCSYVMEKIVYE